MLVTPEQAPSMRRCPARRPRSPAPGSARGRDLARHADDPSRVLDGEAHPLEQRLAVEHGVRVDTADVPVARDVQRRVPSLRLAAVLLVDDDEVRMTRAAVDGTHGLRREDMTDEHLSTARARTPLRAAPACVGGAVVDHDDLELGVVEPRNDRDRRLDDGLLVVRGDDDAHRDREAGRAERLVVGALSSCLRTPFSNAPTTRNATATRFAAADSQADEDDDAQQRPSCRLAPPRRMASMRASAASRNRSPPAA